MRGTEPDRAGTGLGGAWPGGWPAAGPGTPRPGLAPSVKPVTQVCLSLADTASRPTPNPNGASQACSHGRPRSGEPESSEVCRMRVHRPFTLVAAVLLASVLASCASTSAVEEP